MQQMSSHLKNKQLQEVFNSLAMEHRDSIIEMQRRGDRQGLSALQESLISQTEAKVAALPRALAHRKIRNKHTQP